ncbi:MAG TPA: polysaccharide biosynthesis C-terminal domain-containing protein [Candidatus Blautia avicola]|uniref:Polysaccharide biosynthesis C-terminal domain-containing protein n=1 Tax=Candidatus Blautia avicola TaxID=2838483 RepID=A0A9D2QU02_9FIRM|nr:polysaccharide biosynthesis C-terminal domain-containing protein [Candidatus Blautia avicola]
MIQTRDTKLFFKYVFPSILSFALSGVYAIVDGFFVGNSLGDVGLSAVNIAYPIVAFIQAVGTGIGMGGAIYYSINKAEKKEKEARMFTAGANWLMIAFSVILTVGVLCWYNPLLRLLGASGKMLSLAEEYIVVVTFGTILQVFGTGLVPLIRNLGGSFYAMIAMMAGFISNIILDYLFVWVWEQGVAGAAIATVIGQGVTMLIALVYIIQKKQFTLKIPFSKMGRVVMYVLKIGIAPFGLAMSPNISLIIINRFSASYGGESAIAVYACIAYMICIIYLIFQGVGDGSQPLISRCYGEGDFARLKNIRRLAYAFAMLLAVIGCVVMYLTRGSLGLLFGTSNDVNVEVAKIIPIFLISVPFVAVTRVTTASFYASEKSALSYLLTFIEPVLMLLLMLLLPPLFGGQVMIWWSTVIARILSAIVPSR